MALNRSQHSINGRGPTQGKIRHRDHFFDVGVVIHGYVSTGHGADDKDDWLVLRQGTGKGHGVVKVALHGEAVALVAGGEVAGDGVFDHLEKSGFAIGGADFELVEELDFVCCVCVVVREREGEYVRECVCVCPG